MKPVTQLGHILMAAVAITPLASAWPDFLPEIDALVMRQDSSSTDTTATDTTATITTATTTAKSTDTTTTDGSSDSTTGSKTTGTATKTGDSTKTTGTTHSTFPATAYMGGVNMLMPALTASSGLYMIEAPTPITFKWNYTSLLGTPTAIDVLAECSAAQRTNTLTMNMTFQETATITWDTNQFEQTALDNRLVTEQYTLVIYDSDTSPSDTAENGYLSPYSNTIFGLYHNQPYQDNGDGWQCVTCSAARALAENQAVGFAMTMSIITVLSFTWYVVGFGVL